MRGAAAWAVTLLLFIIGPVGAFAAETFVEMRLGIEFGKPEGNSRGGVILDSWNTQALPDGTKPFLKIGAVVNGVSAYAVGDQSLRRPVTNYTTRGDLKDFGKIVDAILADENVRHDIVALSGGDLTQPLPIRLIPLNIPAPEAPPVRTETPVQRPAPPAPEPSTAASLARAGIPTEEVEDASGFSLNLAITMTALAGLVLAAFVMARKRGWGRGFALRPATVGPAVEALPEDEEEREIVLARQAVERAEEETYRAPPPAETGGPSWFQQQRERREVERVRQSMEEAERNAGRQPSAPHGHYPYPPPPYGYYPPRTPLSEWFRMAYWGLKIALVLVVAVWAWSVTGTVFSMLGAIVPAPLRAVTVDLLDKMQDAIQKADQGGQ